MADVAVSGSHAYCADREKGLWVIDISNPAVPGVAGTLPTPGMAESVVIDDSYAYVGDSSDGFMVIDISNPALPSPVIISFFCAKSA